MKFRAQLSWAWKSLITLEPVFLSLSSKQRRLTAYNVTRNGFCLPLVSAYMSIWPAHLTDTPEDVTVMFGTWVLLIWSSTLLLGYLSPIWWEKESNLKMFTLFRPRGQTFHSSTCNYKWNLERTSNSSQSTRPVGLVLWEELLEEVKLHITPFCSLLHTLLKDKLMCLQDKLKL